MRILSKKMDVWQKRRLVSINMCISVPDLMRFRIYFFWVRQCKFLFDFGVWQTEFNTKSFTSVLRDGVADFFMGYDQVFGI